MEEQRYDEQVYNYLMSTGRFDANEGLIFAKELESIKSKSYDVLYPEFTAMANIPVSTDAGAGAETITYYQYDQVGFAKIISNYGTDIPRVDLVGKKFTSDIKGIADGYAYSFQDVRAARMAGKPLEQRKANAARKAIDYQINQIAYFGSAENGLNGLFTHPNITTYTLPADGTGSSKKFKDKTPDQVLRDLNAFVRRPSVLTKGVEKVDTLLLSEEVFADLNTRPRSATTDTTIMQFFKNTNPRITVKEISECNGTGTGGADIMFAYIKSADKVTLEIPQPFEQFPPEQKGFETVINCHARCGGVIFYYPLSAVKAEGC